ncbi:MAG TPA: trigger factor [Candidatus Polarisedimenticolia bacterium]|nr:trigger factor [Candidatus Polarisedimenticolia bacterium]
MKVDVQEMGACKRRLQVQETPEVVRQAWETAFTRVQREAKLPGFRKGKVPRSMIKLHFADDVRQEVARHLIPEVYKQALEETRLDPIEDPDVQDVTLEESAALKFSAVVEVKPVIALDRYTGLTVTHQPKPFQESEIDEALSHLQEQHLEYRVVERPADVGDLVVLDYTLTPEGMPARAETGYGLVIGSGAVMREIEEAVIGLGPGGSRETRVRFPDDYRVEALRGRSAEVRVQVSEVKEKVLPPLDDDFAKSIGEYETLEALRGTIREGLERRREQENRRALELAVLEAVLAEHNFDVPDALVMRQVRHQIEALREQMRRQGVDPDRLPWDYSKMAEEMRPAAQQAVKRALLIEAIAEKEGFAPSDADVQAEVERLAQAGQRPVEAVHAMLEQSGDLDRIRVSLVEKRTLDFLIDRATVTSA